MNKIMIIGILAIFSSLNAETVTLTGNYAKELINPYKSKMDTITKSISINKSNATTVAQVTSNLKGDDILTIHNKRMIQKITFSKDSCNNILKLYLSQDTTITDKSTRKLSCTILSSNIDLVFTDDKISKHMAKFLSEVDITTEIQLLDNEKKTILKDSLNNKLGYKNVIYSWEKTAPVSFYSNNKLDIVNQITEHSLIRMFEKSGI